ncbi:hypothetical protein ACFWNQ_05730 [Streptomyces virginiae]|uniref:hypothetical protein n=1 Tax=Streptomyces virginiae TaxID=1961 RepID=UPI00365F883F
MAPEPDSSVLVSRGQVYASDSGAEAVPGGGGRLTFTFEAKDRGTTRFTLLHCTFTTCQGNTATRPPETTGPSTTATAGATTPPGRPSGSPTPSRSTEPQRTLRAGIAR